MQAPTKLKSKFQIQSPAAERRQKLLEFLQNAGLMPAFKPCASDPARSGAGERDLPCTRKEPGKKLRRERPVLQRKLSPQCFSAVNHPAKDNIFQNGRRITCPIVCRRNSG